MPYDCRSPSRLFALQIGDTASDQVILFAKSAQIVNVTT